MVYALVGNQNAGKTTIFNRLTNLNQHVGNFPGVTVEVASGKLVGQSDCKIIDLPGLYSLNTISKDEEVTKNFLIREKLNLIINVVDGTNLQRNLYLTLQLKQLGIPMVIVINMFDKLEKYNGKVDVKKLSERLGLPIVTITNANSCEIDKLIKICSEKAKTNLNKKNMILNNKDKITEKYKQIRKICDGIINSAYANKEQAKTNMIDDILTNKIFGIPIFLGIMLLIFYLTFNCIGPYFTDLIIKGIEIVSNTIINILYKINVSQLICSFILDGVFKGIGSVLSFLPIIVTLYFFLSILEDSGYFSRIVFIMDAPLKKLGLSGRSIVPIILGFGCSVPAILATRTIQSEKERKKVLYLIPYISCSAKIPIYSIIVTIFFKKHATIAMFSIYCIGLIIGILSTLLIKKKINLDRYEHFIMEIPNYRIPTLKNTWKLMWNKTKEFINKAFSVLFITSIIVWVLKSFDSRLYATHIENSILAQISKIVLPFFLPLGFKDWRIVTSLIVGVTAKEAIISTLSVLSNANNVYVFIQSIFTMQSAISFIVFILLYSPCIATIMVIKKEFNIKTAIEILIKQFMIAYLISLCVFNICNLILI